MDRASIYMENEFHPTISSWQTYAAEFLQIELSPFHILRIKIDTDVNKKIEGGDLDEKA